MVRVLTEQPVEAHGIDWRTRFIAWKEQDLLL